MISAKDVAIKINELEKPVVVVGNGIKIWRMVTSDCRGRIFFDVCRATAPVELEQ